MRFRTLFVFVPTSLLSVVLLLFVATGPAQEKSVNLER